MRSLVIAAALLAGACTPPAVETPDDAAPHRAVTLPMADAAGNRMEALTERNGRLCTSDGAWCVETGAPSGAVFADGAAAPAGALPLGDDTSSSVWPVIVRSGGDESVLLGVTKAQTEMYSGGGGNISHVTLYRVARGAEPAEVLTFQSSGSFSIRACFDEEDRQARRDACSDEYIFSGDLSLDESNASGPARLVLQTTATTYPGQRSRLSDSTTEAPLQESDLVTASDPNCSYRRVLTFNGAAYEYDAPPPACEDYQFQ